MEKKWWSSSADPSKLSLTIKSGIILVPSLVILASVFGFNASAEDITELINQLAVLVSTIGVIYGLGRKILNSRKS